MNQTQGTVTMSPRPTGREIRPVIQMCIWDVRERGLVQVEKLHKHEVYFFFFSLYRGGLFRHPCSREKWKPPGEAGIKMCLRGSGRPPSHCCLGLSRREASALRLVIRRPPVGDSQRPAAGKARGRARLAGRARRGTQGRRGRRRRARTLAPWLPGPNGPRPSALLGTTELPATWGSGSCMLCAERCGIADVLTYRGGVSVFPISLPFVLVSLIHVFVYIIF